MVDQRLEDTHPHLREFSQFLDKLKTESNRGMVLISTGYLEEQLKQVLLAFFIDDKIVTGLIEGGNAPLGTFSARTDMCFALGLITDREHHDLVQMRKVRNEFAHKMHASFATQSIIDRCKTLHFKARDHDSEQLGEVRISPSAQFNTAAAALILNLVNRAHYVAKERRTSKEWEY